MTTVEECYNEECVFNEDGKCDNIYGIRLDESGECISFRDSNFYEGDE